MELGGTADIPGVSPSSVAEDWYLEEHRPYPNMAASTDMHDEFTTLRQRMGNLTKLARIGRFALGGIGGIIAWEVGGKVLHALMPAQGEVAATERVVTHVAFYSKGDSIASIGCTIGAPACPPNAVVNMQAPSAGRVYSTDTNQTLFMYGADNNNPRCNDTVSGVPPGAQVISTGIIRYQAFCNQAAGGYGYKLYFDPITRGGFSPGVSLGTATATSTASPVYSPAQPTSKAQAELRMQDEFATGNYPMSEQLLQHLDAPLEYPDPRVTEEKVEHRCDVSTPAYENPGGNSVPDPYAQKLPEPLPTNGRPSGAAGAPDPYLRWGSAEWGGDFIDDWPGWGWRHIRAKHGWSAADEAATRMTLASPVGTIEESPTSMRYVGPEYQQSGAICARTVVVEFGEATGPKGVITSFGGFVREAS